MKKLFLILLIAVLALSACAKPGSQTDLVSTSQKHVVIYFANAEGSDLISVKYDTSEKNSLDLPEFIINKLLEGPVEPEMSRTVRAGTRLLSVATDKSLAKVDLSKEFYHEESIYDILAVASIVKSLCSVQGIDQVLITVEGQPLLTTDGSELGILKESDVVFDADALMQDESNITLYFSDLNAEYLVPEIHQIKVRRGESLEKLVMQALINGPQSTRNSPTVPPETKILSIETKDSVCFVNLSSDFIARNSVGLSAERLIVFSIVNSLTELSGIDKVQFLIEGEKKDVYQHMTINEPITRDVSMIRK